MSKQNQKRVAHQDIRLNPISHGIKQHLQSQRGKVLATSLIASSVAFTPTVSAQAVLEEVIVTAQKREQSLQDVPISITALSSRRITDLGITSFEDYAMMMPTVSYKSVGPGTATIIMRGASDGGDGNPSGSQPSIGLYLDDAPATLIASNLDIHIYDIERIEALAGPQGTLFGASSQSGNLRIITKQPNSDEFEAGIDIGVNGVDGGEAGYSVEGFANIPINDSVAMRLVAWNLEEGGYIDNIAGSRTYQLEGGYGYSPGFNGGPFGRTNTINNASLVEDDFNDLTKHGMRAALRVDLNDSWTATGAIYYQEQETDGTWDHDPTNVGNGNIQRFYPDFSDDEFIQGSLKIEGEFADHKLVYAGSYMDRDVQYQSDYTAYGEDAYWVPYYVCDYTASGPSIATQSNTDCTSLEEYYQEDNKYDRQSHEVRIQSTGDNPLNYTFGAYYTKIDHEYLLEWVQPGIAPSQAVPGKGANVFFRTDQKRSDEQSAIFGEVTYDLNESFSVTGGFRVFWNDSDLAGVVGWGPTVFGGVGDTSVDAKYSDSDHILKGNVTWRITDDHLAYFTYSEGYRPGGLNRDPGLAAIGAAEFKPDVLTNYEIGLKTTWLDNRLRLNGAVYMSDWEEVQYTIYSFALSACCGSVYNLGDAEIMGFEVDATLLVNDNWTISGAMAYNDGETEGDFTLFTGLLAVPDGTALPNVPEIKGNISSRYEFNVGNFNAYGQVVYSHTGSSYNEIRPSARTKQASYDILNFRVGIDQGDWGVDAYVNNVTNEVAQLYVSARPYEPSTTTNRPLNFGAKFWKRF